MKVYEWIAIVFQGLKNNSQSHLCTLQHFSQTPHHDRRRRLLTAPLSVEDIKTVVLLCIYRLIMLVCVTSALCSFR